MKLYSFAFAAVALAAVAATQNGCDSPNAQSSAQVEQKTTEQNQQRLLVAYPPPVLERSLERANLIERLKRVNQQNASGYVYFISFGQVVAFYPVRGKCTSLNAYLSGDSALVPDPYRTMMSENYSTQSIEMPDYDGAYGKNADGIFCFTADTNALIEWKGDYLYTDQPLKVSQPVQLTREMK